MSEKKYTWVKTHEAITKYLSSKQESQFELIELLKSVGITPFNDKSKQGTVELDEIDPFTFYCYIYKYGPDKRLRYLQEIAKKISAPIPFDESGLPSAQAQSVWLFPYKFERNNNEISRLWEFFKKAIDNNIKDSDFSDILDIKSVGKTKITEVLFYIKPDKYLPINGPTKPFIELELGIDSAFNTFSDYLSLLEEIKAKTNIPFHEISYKAWLWNEANKGTDVKYAKQLYSFLEQAKTNNLKTKHYIKTYKGLDVKVSFGQGNTARIPWISFLKEPFTTSNGIYPVYLYYKDINKLILAYGVSETNSPITQWCISDSKSISKYFEENYLGKPPRYGASFIFKIYDIDNLPNEDVLNEDLDTIIDIYSEIESCDSKPLDSIQAMNFDFTFFKEACKQSGLQYSDQLLTRYISSLATKPFVILSGLSGSGKTKLAQAFAQWICESKEQYSIVPVGADWINREPLLGYVNALEPSKYVLPENGALELIINANKEENQNKPHFLILDEMNLSHVERYFADFLSVMETKDEFKLHTSGSLLGGGSGIQIAKSYRWPKNLFVIGTVNIDETTYMFSPKVLDRANVIEFRIDEDEMSTYLENPVEITELNGDGASMAYNFVEISKDKTKTNPEELSKALNNFFIELQQVGAEFGYRTASEIQTLFSKIDAINPEFASPEKLDAKIDFAIMQKLLPKLHGSRSKLASVLKLLASLCYEIGEDGNPALSDEDKKEIFNPEYKILTNIIYPISLEKITRMYKNVIANGFTSYAEA